MNQRRYIFYFRTWLTALVLALMVLSISIGCSGEEEEEPFGSSIGDGSGGEAVGENLESTELLSSTESVLGSFTYDADYFETVTEGTLIPLTLLNCTLEEETDELSDCSSSNHSDPPLRIYFIRISGLADTSCRFQAAVLGRDEDYDVGDFGDVDNSNDLTFHRVDVTKSGSAISFYCTKLSGSLGYMIQIESTSESMLTSVQVFHLLNSIAKG